MPSNIMRFHKILRLPVCHIIPRHRNAVFGHTAELQVRHTIVMSTSHSVNYPVTSENIVLLGITAGRLIKNPTSRPLEVCDKTGSQRSDERPTPAMHS